ncbi:MAG: PSD1 and planctomycete cytochrome C domain-containing protein [Planctomyces sp.]
MPSRILAFAQILTVGFAATAASLSAEDQIDFNRQIRPILSDLCFSCHGPDNNQRQAGLRLDTAEGARAVLESGHAAIVPSDPAASTILSRIVASDPDVVMPPPATGKSATPAQVELLTAWIRQGAEYRGHWSFIRPERSPVPAVKHSDRVANPIDNFIFSRLEAAGLAPSPEADRVTLIRRATFDLTGLPPTPAEIDQFLTDDSPEAFSRLIDRLQQSPRYGEQMARYWLDLARYGDTHGLHLDNERSLWKYRDWVIAAFNQNKPFDSFAVEQLAGDLLPEATLDQKIATGFNRCNVTTSEGGSIDEEVLVRYAVDRTETMSTVFMGMTLGCAVCHDHKFDPVTQKEFYQLYAFFNASADAAMDGNALAPPPILKAPSAEETARLAQFDADIAAARTDIDNRLAAFQYTDPGTAGEPVVPERGDYVWIEDDAPPGAQLQGDTPWEFVTAPDHPVQSGTKSTRRRADALSQHFFTGANPTLKIGAGDRLFAWVWLDPRNPPKTVMLQFNDGAWEHRAFWGEDAIPFGSGDTPGHRAMGPLPETGKWVRLEVDAAHVGLPAGSEINGWAFTQFGGEVWWDHAGSVTQTPQAPREFSSLAAWEAFDRSLEKSPVPQPVRDAIKVEADKRSPDQQQQIRRYFLTSVYGPSRKDLEPLQKRVDELTKQRNELDAAIPVSMIMQDLPKPRDTFVLRRGEYTLKGEKVEPGVPAIFPALPADAPRNRLGLARWLTDPAHPLTARVAVNRFWQQIFGTGIVKTAEDFGSQGQWPSNPELLDWLAVDFVESGWDIRRLLKQIMLSAAYRQTSRVTPELLLADPANELLSRGARYRLDAEVVRDSALLLGGLLRENLGGKSVRPYQPDGIWEAVAFVGSTTQYYKRDSGDALYRRSVYTFWKRTAPPPSLMAFDAPSRETCVARRARTTTPLQALVLMNDEQYVEAARNLASRMLQQPGDLSTRLSWGFRLCTGRTPETGELEVLLKTHLQHQQHFAATAGEADKLLAIGLSPRLPEIAAADYAAMTMTANLLLNLDETITRE